MKYGIQYLYWRKDLGCTSYLPYLEKARETGFDILELGDYLVLEMSEGETRELAAAARCHEIGLTAGLDPPAGAWLTDDSAAVRERGIAFYAKALARMEALGIHTMGGNILNAPARAPFAEHHKREWEHGVAAMRRLGELAGRHGVTLCMEVMNRFEGHIFNTARDGRRFAGEVGSPHVKLLLDGFHMNIEESSFANAILDAGEALGHFHFIENHRGLPGTGHIPWAEVRDALRQTGYDGAMVMEALVQPGGTLGDCVHIWRDMTGAKDEAMLDQNARDALAYAKYLFRQGTL